jgi:hypothetical protein
VIVIDEIGRELEAQAARTIAERGVQLIATAHGNALDNLMLNPTLSDLVGGIESVTLSDEEARRRGTQKVVLERRAPPTFDVLVEIQSRDRLVVHEDVALAVDAALRNQTVNAELRLRGADGDITCQPISHELKMLSDKQARATKMTATPNGNGNVPPAPRPQSNGLVPLNGGRKGGTGELVARPVEAVRAEVRAAEPRPADGRAEAASATSELPAVRPTHQPIAIYSHGIARNRLQQTAKRLRVPLTIIDDLGQANAVVTMKNFYRRRPKLLIDAERRGTPIYVLRANTNSQIEDFVMELFGIEADEASGDELADALREANGAIQRLQSEGGRYVDLEPQEPHIRREQHILAHRANLASESHGTEPSRFVRIYGAY